jgi:uncharacterized protein (DUF1697 family)
MKYVTFLRGINVGGRRKLQMKDLVKLLEGAGFDQVQTYIQSGNIVFDYEESNISKISDKIKNLIKEKYGYDVPVITISKSEFSTIVENNPFLSRTGIDLKQLYVAFLDKSPESKIISEFHKIDVEPDEAKIIERSVYVKLEGLTKDTKLTNNFIESKLMTEATTRNWNTVMKVNSMLGNIR